MKYIIMCGGKYTAWKTPRQMLEVKGESLVARTIRLLRENGVKEIAISTKDKRFERFGVPLLEHDSVYTVDKGKVTEGFWCTCFYPMCEPACYLFGDVLFSDEAVEIITQTETHDVAFFASAPPFADNYTKPWAEPFAFKVQDQQSFRDGITKVRRLFEQGAYWRHPIAWELWAAIKGMAPNEIDFTSYTVINDYTCDIDDEKDIRSLLEKV